MPLTTTGSGVRIEHPETVAVEVQAAPGAAPRRAGRRSAPADPVRDGLLAGLAQQGLGVGEVLILTPEAGPAARRGRDEGPVRIEVPLGGDEAAMLLVEQDGTYVWTLPQADTVPGRRRGPGQATAVFVLGATTAPAAGGRRSILGDLIAEQLIEPARAYVVRVAARWLVRAGRRRLEENVETGLVNMVGEDPAAWQRWPAAALGDALASRGSPRALLFLHGCFSSTAGSFGALGATPWGRAMLAALRRRYGILLGYDHATLSASPEENARALLDELHSAGFDTMPQLDIVAFSRGGLVARALMQAGVTPERAVFVCSPITGTALAEPKAWHAMLDLSTNLAVAAGRSLALVGLPTTATVVAESVKTLGGLARAVLEEGVDAEQVPGLAAMRPGAPMLQTLAGQVPDRCYAVTSDFAASLAQDGSTLPHRLVQMLLDKGAGAVIREANDLVVPCASALFGAGSAKLAGTVRWAANGAVYHTVAFLQPGLSAALSGWLLEDAGSLPAGFEAPAGLLDADDTLDDLARAAWLTAAHPAQSVVLRRKLGTQWIYYARRVGELLAALREPGGLGRTLTGVLDLHETDAAVIEAAGEAAAEIGPFGAVLLGPNGTAVGVAPAPARAAWLVGPAPAAPLAGGGAVRRSGPERPSPRSSDPFAEAPAPEAPPLVEPRPSPASPRRSAPRTRLVDEGKVRWNTGSARPLSLIGGDVPIPFDMADVGSSAVTEERVEAEVRLNLAAQVAEKPTFGALAEVEVKISREAIEAVVGRLSADAHAMASPSTPITLEIQPRANCKVVGAARVESIRVPDPDHPETYVFKVEATRPGQAEFWVDALQGPRRLARLVLQPVFAEAERMLTASAPISTRAVDPPLAELRIFEFGVEGGYRLFFTLQCRELNLQVDGVTDTLGTTKDVYVESLYRQLEANWGQTKEDFDNFMASIRPFGATLYKALMPPNLRKKMWEFRDRIGSIEVVSHEPFIPWELACIVDPDDDAGPGEEKFMAELGLVRWIRNQGFAPATLRLRPGMARYVIPDYAAETWQLDATAAEIKFLQEEMKAQPVTPRAKEVREFLGRGDGFDLLHFACHGEAHAERIWEAALLLQGRMQGNRYEPEAFDAQQVEHYARLRQSDGGRPMVFLNACQAGRAGHSLGGTGGMAEAFVKRGAGLFVGTQWSVGDVTALTFARMFYDQLRAGNTLTQAVRTARETARQAQEPTWLAYTVYGHPYARLGSA